MSATAFQRMRREREAREQAEKVEKPKTLVQMTVPELKAIAKEKGIEGFDNMKKAELIEAIQKPAEPPKEPEKEPSKETPKEPDNESSEA